jgi:hypothetical protein
MSYLPQWFWHILEHKTKYLLQTKHFITFLYVCTWKCNVTVYKKSAGYLKYLYFLKYIFFISCVWHFLSKDSVTFRSHRLLTVCLVQNDYSSPSMPQPYEMVSSLQPSAVRSPTLFTFRFRAVHQLIFARAILLLNAVVHSMSHLASRQQHTGIPCYWQLLDSEALMEVDYT